MAPFRSLPWVAAGLLALVLLVAAAERELVISGAATQVALPVLAVVGLLALLIHGLGTRVRIEPPDLKVPASIPTRFATAIEQAENLALSSVDRAGRVTSFSRGATALFGFEAEEITGRPLAGALYASSEEPEFLAEISQIFGSGRAHPPRKALVFNRLGQAFEALAFLFPIENEGRVTEVGLLHLDPRVAEGADGMRLRLFHSAPAGLLRVDAAGRIQVVNRMLSDWTGRRAQSLEGTDVTRSEILPVALRDRIGSIAAAGAGSAPVIEEEVTLVNSEGGVQSFVALIAKRRGGGADIVLVDGTSRVRMRSDLEAARAALAIARETAAETIQSSHRDLTHSVEDLMSAFESVRDETSAPKKRAEAEQELEKSGRRFLAHVADAHVIGGRIEPPFSGSPGSSSRPRVLLVDDNDENRELIAHMLRSRGADVVDRGSGREAVDTAARMRFDFVLLDVQMPEMDGYQVVRRLRSLPGGDELPVVALTALTSETVRDRCVAEGMDDFLSKPVTLAAISELLARWGKTRRT